MNTPLALAFLFYIGAIGGWCLEFFYRNLISHRGPKGKYFINPGLCKGPWLPIYGIGLALMFAISYSVSLYIDIDTPIGHLTIVLAIMITMVIIELIGGLFLLKVLNLRLWDYRDRPGNFMGIICPLFTLIWGAIGAAYYLFIHKHAIDWLIWLSQNLAFSFFVGLFFGFFIVDITISASDAAIVKKYGDDHDVVVKYEELKQLLLEREKEAHGKQKAFFDQVKLKHNDLHDTLQNAEHILEDKKEALKSHRKMHS